MQPIRPVGDNRHMPFLYFLADTFIRTFGITQPTQRNRKQAAFFILTLLLLMIIALVVAGLVIHAVMK